MYRVCYIMNKQSKFKFFLDTQANKESFNWKMNLDANLNFLANTINEIKKVLAEKNPELLIKFNEKSIPFLKEKWKRIFELKNQFTIDFSEGQSIYREQKELIKYMMSNINSWYRTTNICIFMEVEYYSKYYGHARLINKFSIKTSNNFSDNKIW